MKCPYCGQEHPDDFKFCPISGQPLVPQTKVCENPKCKYENVPIEANAERRSPAKNNVPLIGRIMQIKVKL